MLKRVSRLLRKSEDFEYQPLISEASTSTSNRPASYGSLLPRCIRSRFLSLSGYQVAKAVIDLSRFNGCLIELIRGKPVESDCYNVGLLSRIVKVHCESISDLKIHGSSIFPIQSKLSSLKQNKQRQISRNSFIYDSNDNQNIIIEQAKTAINRNRAHNIQNKALRHDRLSATPPSLLVDSAKCLEADSKCLLGSMRRKSGRVVKSLYFHVIKCTELKYLKICGGFGVITKTPPLAIFIIGCYLLSATTCAELIPIKASSNQE